MGASNALFGLFGKLFASAGLILTALFTGTTLSSTSNVPPPVVAPVATSTPARTETAPKPAATSTPKTKPAAVATTTPSPAPKPVVPAIDPDVLNTETRASVVNILCNTGTGGYTAPISGSGVIIDSRGIILTNAHVAQLFLLRNYPTPDNIRCVVRTGSPARALYTAELLYLPPQWIAANASQVGSSRATGTGENDYAFLRINGTTDPNGSLPESFPHLAMSLDTPGRGEQMLLASYPASFLQGLTIETNLYLTSAYAVVGQLFVFHQEDTWIGLFSIPGTVDSQGGSSGGAAVRASDGTLAGIIVTSTDSETTAGRDLRAVSIAHIEHSLRASNLGGILGLLGGNAAVTAAYFNKHTAPGLTEQLIKGFK